jgi:hypothetical protein
MSTGTKAIEKVLKELEERLQDALDGPAFSRDQTALDNRRLTETKEALAKLETIREAARVIVKGCYVQAAGSNVREKMRVMRLLESIAKEEP